MASASIARADALAPARLAVRLIALLAVLAGALLLHGAWRAVRAPSPWPPRFLAAVGWIAGARRRTIGRPLGRNTLMLANHQSWLDILVIAGASGSAFVAKGELAGVPLIGWLCRLNRTIFVARSERLAIADQIAALREGLAGPQPVTIFPEGTTGDGHGLLPFKASLLAVLEPPPPGTMVQPVLVDYGAATGEIAWVGNESGAANAKRILSRAGGFDVTVCFLEPFDPAHLAGRKAIAAEARARMDAAFV